jgi:hypothetical protein
MSNGEEYRMTKTRVAYVEGHSSPLYFMRGAADVRCSLKVFLELIGVIDDDYSTRRLVTSDREGATRRSIVFRCFIEASGFQIPDLDILFASSRRIHGHDDTHGSDFFMSDRRWIWDLVLDSLPVLLLLLLLFDSIHCFPDLSTSASYQSVAFA